MILQAKRDHEIDLSRSFFIGDKEIDVECGRNAGVRTIRVQTGFQTTQRAVQLIGLRKLARREYLDTAP